MMQIDGGRGLTARQDGEWQDVVESGTSFK
jgi:hypothetical protein